MGGGPSKLVKREQQYWEGEHTLAIDKDLRSKQRPLIEGLSSPMRLCYICLHVDGVPFDHFYITDGSTRIEYGDSQLLERTLRIYAAPGNATHVVERDFEFSQDVKARLLSVLGATNYSLALRNSEHMARYISSGSWFSVGMSGGTPLHAALSDWLGDKVPNTLPTELVAKPPDPSRLTPMYRDLESDIRLEFKEMLTNVEPRPGQRNVVLIGPTGAGKSTIINALFNCQVAKAKHSPQSVTRHMDIYSGVIHLPGGGVEQINVMDSVGFCDSVLEPKQVMDVVKGYIKASMMTLDKVVVVCAGRVEKAHADAVKNFMAWLKYEQNKSAFVFIYNKAEDLEVPDRIQSVADMCALLGADARWSCIWPIPNSKEGRQIRYAFAMGLPPRRPFAEVRHDVAALYDAVVRYRKDHRPLVVNPADCSIL